MTEVQGYIIAGILFFILGTLNERKELIFTACYVLGIINFVLGSCLTIDHILR